MSSQKIVLVTGASSGIGRAVARRLAGDGMTVIAAARRPLGAARSGRPSRPPGTVPTSHSSRSPLLTAGARLRESHPADEVVGCGSVGCPVLGAASLRCGSEAPQVRAPAVLRDGDRVQLGAWTRLTVRAG